MKKTLTYTRKYQLGPYITGIATAEVEFNLDELPPDFAFAELRTDVIEQMKKDLEEKQKKSEPITPTPSPPANTSAPSEYESTTEWRETKNPNIFWCPGKEADQRDVDKALKKEDGMWTTEDPAYGLSIFKKVKKVK